MVTLKSPQILIKPLCLTMGTIGAAHFDNWTGDNIPSAINLSNSFSTLSFKASGTGLGLKNFGQASWFTLR